MAASGRNRPTVTLRGSEGDPGALAAAAPGEPGRRAFLGLAGAGLLTAAGAATARAETSPGSAPGGGEQLPSGGEVLSAGSEALPAVGDTVTTPRTLHGPAVPGPLRPGFDVQYVSVRWPAEASPRIRIHGADGVPGPWRPVTAQGCGGGDGPDLQEHPGLTPKAGTALLVVGGAPTVELDLPGGATAVALNTTDGPRRQVRLRARDARHGLAGARYLSRAFWGADESLRFRADGTEIWPATYWPVQAFTVHHTIGSNPDDPAAYARAVYTDHAVEQGWGDIGYHFLVDEAGRVYEGRWSGDDRVPGFDAEGRMVNAGHVGGYNAGNVGIALMGDLTSAGPTPAARRTLVRLLAGLAAWQGIDPLGRVSYVNPISGASATVDAISGHRDWPGATECPGEAFHPLLPGVRRDVARLVARLPRRSAP